MACPRPLLGYRSKTVNPSGKRSIVFNPKEAFYDMPVNLPCGQCIDCRLKKTSEWAIRCVHEASLHEHNCFLTLTYEDDKLPDDGSLKVKHFQDFMKRLRRWASYRGYEGQIKYFHCGEYGETYSRPHYHACVFNFDFLDKELWEQRRGMSYYVSPTLQKLWPHGFHRIGEVTFESAAYVARYVLKKMTGERQDWYYVEKDPDTGEVIRDMEPEYATMSKRPPIGKGWFEKYRGDCYPSGFIIVQGRKVPPPKFYLRQLEIVSPEEFARERGRRMALAEEAKDHPDNQHDRLLVREEVRLRRLEILKRSYEDGS